jgi:uncharacterized membrane protein
VSSLQVVYVAMGLLVGAVALSIARDRRHPTRVRSALFWGLYAATFLAGSHLSPLAAGLAVIAMAVLAAARLSVGPVATTSAAERAGSARRHGSRLFLPALLVPAVTVTGTLALPHTGLVDPKQVTLVSLALGSAVALAAALVLLRPPARAPVHEARRLMDAIGWAAVLPQMLAALGAVFADAGVGGAVSQLLGGVLPLDRPLVAVVTYTVGMALLTVLTGNAFAAFPVMTAAVGLPLIVHRAGGDPVVMAALGMLSGFCGTLLTPMAANFNVVPARLLELPDERAVIRVQTPTALLLLAVNTVLMYACVFR